MRTRTPPPTAARRLWLALLPLALAASAVACGDDGGTPPASDSDVDAGPVGIAPGSLRFGEPCSNDVDCISGECLETEYGPPFCTYLCDEPQITCPAAPDALAGTALCVSYDDRPEQDLEFKGEASTFCVPLCTTVDECQAVNGNWEECTQPKHLGNPIYPNLGNQFVCQAPSFQGKDPVDPIVCDWEKTRTTATASNGELCRKYCEYLDTCQEIPGDTVLRCCEWGCFNAMYVEGELNVDWQDNVKCHIQAHAAYPPVGPTNSCTGPTQDCFEFAAGAPVDPTPQGAQ